MNETVNWREERWAVLNAITDAAARVRKTQELLDRDGEEEAAEVASRIVKALTRLSQREGAELYQAIQAAKE